ncbi:class I SAM-dependent methyltransferase [Ramlibacter tataouinensis]|uniref:class I SAM-dependent methyltransferase n=1 Tax=Ramlibacter tataouinensis TaxID=94132 RepID=UPI0022F3CB6D|nr:class I SAM-dependent methyltransferase [Ramlibacter tataouinensis]WBY00722.1 class I SAM-dependent methyltransferase [Ramlibacter tataouinensis]
MKSSLAALSRSVASYWTSHNVTAHKTFGSREESLDYFHWRCDQYPGYLDLMPVAGVDGMDVLDYGCGPGHDLVGFLEYSKPRRLIGVDVSRSSLAEAKGRLELHGGESTDLRLIDPNESELPFPDASFDYVHSSGVLHHVPDLQASLREIRRVLRPSGRARVMVYNFNSLWTHLYVAYTLQIRNKTITADLPVREAFKRSTDGPDCPIANCYTAEEFGREAAAAGFDCRPVGVAVSLHELQQLQQFRFEACMDPALRREHREFLLALTLDGRGTPHFEGVPAGIDLVLELLPRE